MRQTQFIRDGLSVDILKADRVEEILPKLKAAAAQVADAQKDLAPEVGPLPEMPLMPDGARTNVPPASPGDAVNVLLIDTLNTDMPEQEYVRHQVMQFFARLQPGTRMAIRV